MLQSFIMSTLAAPPALTRVEITARVRDRLLAARDDVLGIVLFGSFARGQSWRDVDVLVVVETLPKSPHDYNRQAAALSQAVGWPPTVDLLLYSHRDFGLNLADHTPLFLDIAFDGQVLYDKRDIAQKLETTRAEVTARGIQRTPTGGWRFPVRYRAATALSPTRNQDWTEGWLNEAAEDVASAEALAREAHHARCVYLCQQAVEKSVKAILVCFGAFERTHRVAELLRAELERQPTGPWADALKTLAAISANLEPDVSRARYPGEREGAIWEPAKGYTEEQATTALADARQSLTIARDFVNWWFNPPASETTLPA